MQGDSNQWQHAGQTLDEWPQFFNKGITPEWLERWLSGYGDRYASVRPEFAISWRISIIKVLLWRDGRWRITRNSAATQKWESTQGCLLTVTHSAKEDGAATDWEMGAGETAKWLSALTVLTQHSGSISSTHIRWLKPCNSKSKGSGASDLHGHLHSIYIFTFRYIQYT